MVPWTKLPKDVQKTILALIIMSGGSSVTSCCPPVVCDPPPPPKTAPPSLTRTPIICDPIPPPSVTRRPTATPMVCDPAPPPSLTPRRTATPVICDPPPPPATRSPQATRTAVVVRKFQLRSLQMTSDPTLKGAAVRGTVYDKQGQPLEGIKVTVRTGTTVIDTATARNGSFFLRVTESGAWQLVVGEDTSSERVNSTRALPLQLKLYDVANVEWAEIGSASQAPLPLAEIRTVDILWGDDLTFQVETPWPGARYRWSVTGGTLVQHQIADPAIPSGTSASGTAERPRGMNDPIRSNSSKSSGQLFLRSADAALVEQDEQVMWQPPAEPGRYLLQLVADWGYEGLAVDSLVLTVNRDGSIYIS